MFVKIIEILFVNQMLLAFSELQGNEVPTMIARTHFCTTKAQMSNMHSLLHVTILLRNSVDCIQTSLIKL